LIGNRAATPPSELVRNMMRGEWRGNVRELRSAVERSLIGAPEGGSEGDAAANQQVIPFRTAKSMAAAAWAERYLAELLPAHGGNGAGGGGGAKMTRSHLSELVHRHGLASIAGDDLAASEPGSGPIEAGED